MLRVTDNRILRATLTVGALTLLAKAGFIGRDLIVAWRFGRSPMFEAFPLAFVIPYSVTAAISSSLTSAFLPDFIRLKQAGENGTAKQLYSGLLAWLPLVSAALMLLRVLLQPLYARVVAASLSVESWELMRGILFLAAPGSVAALNYGRKAVTFPLAVSAMAFVKVTPPYLSELVAAHDWAGLRNTLHRFLALIFALNAPVAMALAVWSKPIVRWLFERGQFGPPDTEVVAGVLFYYAFSLPFFVAFMAMMKLLSSLRARVTPVLFSAAALALDVVLNCVLPISGKAAPAAASSAFSHTLPFPLAPSDGNNFAERRELFRTAKSRRVTSLEESGRRAVG